MLDETGRLWLLECNHGPCFPKLDEHPLQAPLYHRFWRELINMFVAPILDGVSRKKQHGAFMQLQTDDTCKLMPRSS